MVLARLRRHIADPPPEPADADLPGEALSAPERRRHFNARRQRDPLGEGQPDTWRTRLIKVAAEVVVTTRRVLVKLSAHWPYLHHYRQVSRQVLLGRATFDTS